MVSPQLPSPWTADGFVQVKAIKKKWVPCSVEENAEAGSSENAPEPENRFFVLSISNLEIRHVPVAMSDNVDNHAVGPSRYSVIFTLPEK
jgi:hypothetical protein